MMLWTTKEFGPERHEYHPEAITNSLCLAENPENMLFFYRKSLQLLKNQYKLLT